MSAPAPRQPGLFNRFRMFPQAINPLQIYVDGVLIQPVVYISVGG